MTSNREERQCYKDCSTNFHFHKVSLVLMPVWSSFPGFLQICLVFWAFIAVQHLNVHNYFRILPAFWKVFQFSNGFCGVSFVLPACFHVFSKIVSKFSASFNIFPIFYSNFPSFRKIICAFSFVFPKPFFSLPQNFSKLVRFFPII